MQTMQIRALPPLGVQSSGLFGDVKSGNFAYLPPKELPKFGIAGVRATYSRPGSNQPPVPSRSSQPPPGLQQQSTPTPLPSEEAPPAGENTFAETPSAPLPRSSPEAPNAPEDRNFTPARPPSSSPGLGLNFPGSPIPGLPGSPRPKPGTPRPYDPTKQKSKVMEWLTPPPPPTELLQREHYRLSPSCTCTIYFGDLSKWSVDGKCDAVIAPANKRLNTGPAVNAVLFKAAGSRLLDATQRLPDVAPQGIKAEVGDAISTRAFNLPVSRVIHTVGPVYKKNETGTRISDDDLVRAYKSALDIARKENLTCLAFPPLSCRIYGYPYSEGAEVALKTLKENCEGFTQIDIVIRNIEGYDAFIDEANRVLEVIREKKTIKLRMGGDSVVTQATPTTIPPQLNSPPQLMAPATPLPPPPPPPPPPAASFTAPPQSPSQPSPPPFPQEERQQQQQAPYYPPRNYPTAPGPYANPPPRNYQPTYSNQNQGPYSDPQPRRYEPTYPNPNAGPYSDPPPRNYHPTYPNPKFQDSPPQTPPVYEFTPPTYQGYQGPPSPPRHRNPPPQYQQNPPPPAAQPPPYQQHQQYQQQYQPEQYQQYQQSSQQYQQQPQPPQQYQPQDQQQQSQEYQQEPLPEYRQSAIPPYNPPPPPPPPPAQDSSFVPPRQRASPIPPSGPPPTPPSSPTMPYPKRYEY